MSDISEFQQFLYLLDKCGLPVERKEFWLSKINNGAFTELDYQLLTDDINAHLDNIDTALAASEIQLEEANNNFEIAETNALPYLKEIASRQDEFQNNKAKDYKNAILQGEKDMMSAIEGIRTTKTTEDIEAIRKFLKKE